MAPSTGATGRRAGEAPGPRSTPAPDRPRRTRNRPPLPPPLSIHPAPRAGAKPNAGDRGMSTSPARNSKPHPGPRRPHEAPSTIPPAGGQRQPARPREADRAGDGLWGRRRNSPPALPRARRDAQYDTWGHLPGIRYEETRLRLGRPGRELWPPHTPPNPRPTPPHPGRPGKSGGPRPAPARHTHPPARPARARRDPRTTRRHQTSPSQKPRGQDRRRDGPGQDANKLHL